MSVANKTDLRNAQKMKGVVMKYPEFFGTRFFQSALCIVEHDRQAGVSSVMVSQWRTPAVDSGN